MFNRIYFRLECANRRTGINNQIIAIKLHNMQAKLPRQA